MRIVFMGTPDFAVHSLQALLDAREQLGLQIVGVFTQPDRPKGRGNKLQPPPVKVLAAAHGIPVYQPRRIRTESVEDMKALAPDLCVTAAFGQIISQELLDIPLHGTINVHASLLPRHRGSAPIAWSILQGDDEVGITTMLTDKGIDTGDMLLQKSIARPQKATCGELTETLGRLGAELLIETIRQLQAGTLRPIPQNEAEMTYDPKLSREMGVIDWSSPARDIALQVLALNPWPACAIPWQEGSLKLLRAEAYPGTGRPGEILAKDAKQGLVIACGADALKIITLQAPGGKAMAASDYLRGHPLAVDNVLAFERED